MNAEVMARWSARIAEGSALAAAVIGAVGFAGWLTGVAGLARWTGASIPLSPASAGTLALLGTAVFFRARWPARRVARRTAAIIAIAVSGLSLLVLAQFVVGFDLGLGSTLVRSTDSVLDTAAVRVSPVTAIALLLAAVSLIDQLAFPQGEGGARHAAAALGVGVVAIALTVLVGYSLGRPLLYGGTVHPVALPTASGLALLGAALVAAALARPAGLDAGAPAGSAFRRSARMRYVPIALATGAGLLLSGVLATIVSRLEAARSAEDFTRWADNTTAALRLAIAGTSDALADVKGDFAASREVQRAEFRAFASEELSHHAEAQALGWVPRVADREGAEHYPILYLQSKERDPVAPGFDLASEPALRAALERARDTGAMTASAPLILALPGRPRGFLLATPVYRRGAPGGDVAARRAALAGFFVGAVRIGDLVAVARLMVRAHEMFLELVDATDRAHPVLLYADLQALVPGAATIGTTTEFDVGGRTWMARIRPTVTHLAAQHRWDAWLVFAGGLLLTILIAAHLYSLERYSADVETAHRLVAESEGRFRAIAESASDSIITIDATGTIIHCNASAGREFGYEEGGLLGRNVRDIVPQSHIAAHTAGLAQYRATGQALIVGETHELPALHRDGSEFPIDLSLAIWETREGRFATAIIRNISDRKSAQAERERLIAELQDALANVRTLSGLLPICAWCKKIRDDKGYWTQLEGYLSRHTEAEFSHGMCPDCEKKFGGGEAG